MQQPKDSLQRMLLHSSGSVLLLGLLGLLEVLEGKARPCRRPMPPSRSRYRYRRRCRCRCSPVSLSVAAEVKM